MFGIAARRARDIAHGQFVKSRMPMEVRPVSLRAASREDPLAAPHDHHPGLKSNHCYSFALIYRPFGQEARLSRPRIAEIFIAAAAQRTRHIKLGTGVVSVSYHNPFWVAERAVLLDHLTRGRFMLGLGPGSLPTDAAMIGLDQSPASTM